MSNAEWSAAANLADDAARNAAGFQSLGDQQAADGKLQEAIISYRRAIRLEGDNPDYHARLGDAYLFAEDSGKALSHYRRALQANPHHADSHFSLAEVYRRFGKLKGAITLYRKAVALAPNNPFYRYRLATAFNQNGRTDSAIHELSEAIRLAPSESFYHHFRSFEREVVPEAVKRGVGVIGMKSLAGGRIAEEGAAQPHETIPYVIGMEGVDTLVSGIANLEHLEANLRSACTPMPEDERVALRERVKGVAVDGRLELYKIGIHFEGWASREQHGLPAPGSPC